MTEFSTVASSNNNEGIEREPLSEGLHSAKCIGVFGIGTTIDKIYNIEKNQVVIIFAVDEYIEIEGKKVPKTISRFFTLSLGKKANLRKALEKWRGKEFTEEELEGFDVQKVLNAPAIVEIFHKEKEGKIKDYIGHITKIDERFKKDVPEIEALTEAPEWIIKLRSESIEAQPIPKKEIKKTIEPTKKTEVISAKTEEIEETEDIPF